MKAVWKIFAAVLCACALAVCLWVARGDLLAPSAQLDEAIAHVCDFAATKEDKQKLSELADSIKSPWWREYAKSRLWEPYGENLKPIQIFERIIKEFKLDDMRAYVLANAALDCPQLTQTFAALPVRDAEFAKIIYSINKGEALGEGKIDEFLDRRLKNLPDRRRDYYRDTLMTQALKKTSLSASNELLPLYGVEKHELMLCLTLKGLNPNSLKGLQKENLWALKTLWALKNSRDEKTEEKALVLAGKNDKTISIYVAVTRAVNCALFYELGERKLMCESLKKTYLRGGKNTRVAAFVSSSSNAIVNFLGTYGDWELARFYIYANVGNSEMTYQLIGAYAIASARMGRLDEAIKILQYYNSLCGRIDANFSRPTDPEAAQY